MYRLLSSISILILFLFFRVDVFAQYHQGCYIPDPGSTPRERNFDIDHMTLKVSFEPQQKLVKGDVTYTLRPIQKQVDTIFFDAPGIRINSLSFNKSTINYRSDSAGITMLFDPPLKWGQKHTININYEANPNRGLYFIGWNDTTNISRKQIWTQGQGIDNRHWIPGFDDQNLKFTTDIEVLFDSKYEVLSNGNLLQKRKQRDGKTLWHYKLIKPHSPYLVMLGIGNYGIKTVKTSNGTPMKLYYYPDQPERVEPTYRYSVEMMDWMEKEFGVKYPWETYAQIPVQDFMYGAMENTTATVFGDFYYIDERAFLDRNYVGTNAHELAHMWFGNYVTAISPKHHWLQESFATHYQKHFERQVFGEDYFQWNRRRELWSVLNAAKQNDNPVAHSKGGSARHYPKGSLVLDMMKYVVGEEQFNRALKSYLQKYPFKLVDTHRFYLAFFDELGIDLNWFFDQWLYRGGEPSYEVNYQFSDTAATQAHQFTVKQVQEVTPEIPLFRMPFYFEIHYTDGNFSSHRVWVEDSVHQFSFQHIPGKTVDFVLFDPNSQVVKQVKFDKPFEMLTAQAFRAKNMIDRYDAVIAMRELPLDQKRGILQQIYANEPFYAVRAAAITQLVNDSLSHPVIAQALRDPHRDVRFAAVRDVDQIHPVLQPNYERLLTDSSYNVLETALVKLSEQYPQNRQQYLEKTKNEFGMGNSIKIRWLEIQAEENPAEALPQLVAYTSPSHEFITRLNAMRALQRLNYLDQRLLVNLLQASFHFNRRLSGPSLQTLKHYADADEHREQVLEVLSKFPFTEWQRSELNRQLNLTL